MSHSTSTSNSLHNSNSSIGSTMSNTSSVSSSSTNNTANNTPNYKRGLMSKKSRSFWKSWREHYFVLAGSSLYYYEKPTDAAPSGVIQLNMSKISMDSKEKRKHVIIVYTATRSFTLATHTEPEYNEWVNALKQSVSLPPLPPPVKQNHKQKQSLRFDIIDATFNFSAARKLLRDYAAEETFGIITSMKGFVSKYDSPETADHLEIVTMQLAAKVAMLYKDKKISKDYILSLEQPLHKLCDSLIDGYEIPFSYEPEIIIKELQTIATLLEKLLRPYLNDKSIKTIHSIISYFCDADLLDDFFTRKKWKECQELGESLRILWDNQLV